MRYSSQSTGSSDARRLSDRHHASGVFDAARTYRVMQFENKLQLITVLPAMQEDIEYEEEPGQQLHRWLLVRRDEVGKLRVGVRAAGIATGEFEALRLRRIQSDLRTTIVCLGDASGAFKSTQLAAAIFSLILETQAQINALSPAALLIDIRVAKKSQHCRT